MSKFDEYFGTQTKAAVTIVMIIVIAVLLYAFHTLVEKAVAYALVIGVVALVLRLIIMGRSKSSK